ncbi:hypothetical protein HMPREF3221_01805, partial [Fusobacterium nucleatum]
MQSKIVIALFLTKKSFTKITKKCLTINGGGVKYRRIGILKTEPLTTEVVRF